MPACILRIVVPQPDVGPAPQEGEKVTSRGDGWGVGRTCQRGGWGVVIGPGLGSW